MLTYYCPHCWETITEKEKICSHCGYVLNEFKKSEYDDKLIASLYHSVSERKIMAAQILGIRQCKHAIPEFQKILNSDETNYFFLRAVLLAIAKMDDPSIVLILRNVLHHPSELVSQLAKELLDVLERGQQPDRWDRHTG